MFDSLKVKILGIISLILVIIITSIAYINFHHQKEMLQEIVRQHASVLAETTKNSISNAMLSGHPEEVGSIFNRFRPQEFVDTIRIVDESGKILDSVDSSEIGRLIPENEKTDLLPGTTHKLGLMAESGGYRYYSRIYNTLPCQKCHDGSTKVLGILEIKLSLNYIKEFIAKEKTTAITSSIILISLILITVTVLLVLYVDKPIRKLISVMQRVENGDFTYKHIAQSSKEMTELTESFNRMVEKTKLMMDTTVNHELDLARAQEKLAHHHKVTVMNVRLEEQINEIENLNISLEERIEEIEEANYKIADLAGELEDRNSTLEKAVAKLSTLYKVGLAINSTMEVERLFTLIVKTTMDTLNAQIGYIIFYLPESNELMISTLIGHEGILPAGGRLPLKASSVSSWVIENSKPLLIVDINKNPEFDRFSAIGYERKTLVCAPLITKNEIIGTITVVNKKDNSTFNHEDLELLTTIAAQASIAIKNAKLYDEQQRTYLNTIQALVSAVEASDSYTSGHSERVTSYSLSLAKKLELPQDRLKVIERAAILHDIGKIGIDLTLLHKEGKLNAEDIHNLQQHPAIGMKILEPIEFLQDVRLCIGQHHERHDGRGYPDGIPGSELLLESRILAIADAFDAMTSDRPYRKALMVEDAIKELLDNAGTQFDPNLVPLFIEILTNNEFPAPKMSSPHLAYATA